MLSAQPFNLGISLASGADQYAYFAGVAADDVAELKIFLANGMIESVPSKTTRSRYQLTEHCSQPASCAYDKDGKVIGNQIAPTS